MPNVQINWCSRLEYGGGTNIVLVGGTNGAIIHVFSTVSEQYDHELKLNNFTLSSDRWCLAVDNQSDNEVTMYLGQKESNQVSVFLLTYAVT